MEKESFHDPQLIFDPMVFDEGDEEATCNGGK